MTWAVLFLLSPGAFCAESRGEPRRADSRSCKNGESRDRTFFLARTTTAPIVGVEHECATKIMYCWHSFDPVREFWACGRGLGDRSCRRIAPRFRPSDAFAERGAVVFKASDAVIFRRHLCFARNDAAFAWEDAVIAPTHLALSTADVSISGQCVVVRRSDRAFAPISTAVAAPATVSAPKFLPISGQSMETPPRDGGAAAPAAVAARKSAVAQRWSTETAAPDAETQSRSMEIQPKSMATERKCTETQAMAMEASASAVSISGQSIESERRSLSILGQSMAISPWFLEIQRQTARISSVEQSDRPPAATSETISPRRHRGTETLVLSVSPCLRGFRRHRPPVTAALFQRTSS